MEKQGKIRVLILTPQRQMVETEVDSVTVPTPLGPDCILYHHAPLISVVEPGLLRYRQAGREYRLVVGSGVMEAVDNRVRVLTDSAEWPEMIDEARAEAAQRRAELRLQQEDPSVDRQRAQRALLHATARLQAAGLENSVPVEKKGATQK